MPNLIERQILKKVCQLISLRMQQCTAKDHLIMVFEDYLTIQPVQKHFFLVTTNLRRLQNASGDSKEIKSLLIDVLNVIGDIPVKYLQEADDLLIRIKLFLQIQPEISSYLNKDYLLLINPGPVFLTVEQELPEVVSQPPPPNPDDNFLYLSSAEASEYLAKIKDVGRYINLLNKLSPTDITINISTLILDNYSDPKSEHDFNMNVLHKCFDKIPEPLLPKLLAYALWLLAQEYRQKYLYTLPVIGKLYQRGLNIPLTEKDHKAPFQESNLLRLVYWLFSSEKIPLAERLEILDVIELMLPKAVKIMIDFYCDEDGFVQKNNIFILIEKISLASEEQKLQFIRNILDNYFYDDKVYGCIADIYNKCNDKTKLAIKAYFFQPVLTKCNYHHTTKLSNYRELFIPKNKSRETIDSLMNLLRDCVHNESYVSYVLYQLEEVFTELESEDLTSLATICLPLIESFRRDSFDRPMIASMLKKIMEKSKDLAAIIIPKTLSILPDIAAESDDNDFTRQLQKVSFILKGKTNYVSDIAFFDSLCLRLSRIVRNFNTEYFRVLSEAVNGQLNFTVSFEIGKARKIITDLSNFFPSEILETIGGDTLAYLAVDESHNKPDAVRFVAENYKYFSVLLQKKMFKSLLPGIIPYNKELGADQMTFFCELQPGVVPHHYRPDIAHKYYSSNYVDNIGYAKTSGYMLLGAFSLNADGTINSMNSIEIINGIFEHSPWAMPRYMQMFADENYECIEKFVIIVANSYADADLDVDKKGLRDTVNRNHYDKYYLSTVKSMLIDNLNSDNDLPSIVMAYIGPRGNTLRPS
jgi:hypothetical protein